jgi:hypothetical protein
MMQTWLISEESGRWAAALRVAFDRSTNVAARPRLIEMRNLTELVAQPNEPGADLVLIEVGAANVARALEVAARWKSLGTPFVALLQDPVEHLRLTDLLFEAGAAEVSQSPRDLRGLLELHTRTSGRSRMAVSTSFERQSLTDWAWSMLPWQGT